MAKPIKEFYVGSMWRYTPAGVERLMTEMNNNGFESAEYLYEQEWNLFKVICQEKDADAIVQAFKAIEEDLERELIEVDEVDVILNPDLTIRDDISNKYISRVYDRNAVNRYPTAVESKKTFQCPPQFNKHQFTTAWTALDHEPITIHGLLDAAHLQELARLSNVEISYDLAGKVVYIGASKKTFVDAAAAKLSVLLKNLKLPSLKVQHVLYGEQYEDYTIDARLVRNIHPHLFKTTLFDHVQVALPNHYTIFQNEGVALRICLFDRTKGFNVSLFGPISTDMYSNTVLRRYFEPFANWKYAAKKKAVHVTSPQRLLGISDPDTNYVKSWVMNQQPCPALIEGLNTSEPQSQVPRLHDGNKLIDTFESPGISLSGDGQETCGKDTSKVADYLFELSVKEGDRLSGDLLSGDLLSGDFPAPEFQSATTQSTIQDAWPLSSSSPLLSHPPQDSNKQVGASESSRVISFGMAPLVPQPSSVAQPTIVHGDDDLSTQENSTQKENIPLPTIQFMDERSADKFHSTMRQKAPRGPKRSPQPSDPSQSFINSIDAAIDKLAQHGRVKTGKICLRVEFGRIATKGWDSSALARNKEGHRSNGYRNDILTEVLNENVTRNQDILFTKVLSIHGNDADFLVKMKLADERNRMWSSHSKRVTYQFLCEAQSDPVRGGGKPERFVVDIDGSESGSFTYSLRKDRSEVAKVFIHAVCRNWDLRVVMTNSATNALEARYGQFAGALLASLVVPDGTVSRPRLEFDQDSSYRVTVLHIRVLHTARYISTGGNSFLDLTQVQDMTISSKQTASAPAENVSHLQAVPMSERPAKGVFTSWFEASISSVKAEELFVQNEELTLGEEAEWTAEQLKQDGVFRSLWGPALQMLKEMDSVGHHNSNGQEIRAPKTEAPTKRREDDPSYSFW